MTTGDCRHWHMGFHLRAIGAAEQFVMLCHEAMRAFGQAIKNARLVWSIACNELWRRHWLAGQRFEFRKFYRWHEAWIDDNLLALHLQTHYDECTDRRAHRDVDVVFLYLLLKETNGRTAVALRIIPAHHFKLILGQLPTKFLHATTQVRTTGANDTEHVLYPYFMRKLPRPRVICSHHQSHIILLLTSFNLDFVSITVNLVEAADKVVFVT